MASLTFSVGSGNSFLPPRAALSDHSSPSNTRDGFNPLKKAGNSRKRLTSTNVASPPLPAVAAPHPPTSKESDDRSHVAWTSVRQERWEGELHVQGQIPLWLVCDSFISKLFISIRSPQPYICISIQL